MPWSLWGLSCSQHLQACGKKAARGWGGQHSLRPPFTMTTVNLGEGPSRPHPPCQLPTLGTQMWVLSWAVGGAIKTPNGCQQG